MFFQYLINMKTMDETMYSFYYITSLKFNVYFTLTAYLNSVQMLSSHVTSGYYTGPWVLNNERSRAFAIEPKLKETYDSIVIIQILCFMNRKEYKGH